MHSDALFHAPQAFHESIGLYVRTQPESLVPVAGSYFGLL
jgi:hypothetical protein